MHKSLIKTCSNGGMPNIYSVSILASFIFCSLHLPVLVKIPLAQKHTHKHKHTWTHRGTQKGSKSTEPTTNRKRKQCKRLCRQVRSIQPAFALQESQALRSRQSIKPISPQIRVVLDRKTITESQQLLDCLDELRGKDDCLTFFCV